MPADLIAVDWGSTRLRARLVLGGETIARHDSADGIRARAGRDCEEILAAACGAWIADHPGLPVYLSGMAGSREGWREAPYALAPAGIADLAAGLVRLPSRVFGAVFLVPGVRWVDPATGLSDVMRGEETQVAGLLESLPRDGATVCLPGTHAKWILCREGRMESFRTWLTGEAFALLTRDSLIAGDGSPARPDSPAFARGLDLSAVPGGLLHQLFLARAEMLAGRAAASDLPSLVSGILLGHEVREATAFAPPPWILVGDSPAAAATAVALAHLGFAAERVLADTHLPGILAIARAAA